MPREAARKRNQSTATESTDRVAAAWALALPFLNDTAAAVFVTTRFAPQPIGLHLSRASGGCEPEFVTSRNHALGGYELSSLRPLSELAAAANRDRRVRQQPLDNPLDLLR